MQIINFLYFKYIFYKLNINLQCLNVYVCLASLAFHYFTYKSNHLQNDINLLRLKFKTQIAPIRTTQSMASKYRSELKSLQISHETGKK